MSGKPTGANSETDNQKSTEVSVKSCIVKLIEDLEKDIQRIEDKIANICGAGEVSRRNLTEDKKTADKEAGLKEAVGEAKTSVSQTEAENVDNKVVPGETEDVKVPSGGKPEKERCLDERGETQDMPHRQSDAETDEDAWTAFIAERAAIPVNGSNIDLTATEAKMADYSGGEDADWDDFCRQRATMTVVDVSDDTGDDWDKFFGERATVDKYAKQTKSKGRLRRLFGRIFGRH